jgi:hypothetical protein
MTSFEQPDAGLLVEQVLPSLLGADYSISQDSQERNLFFGELGTALEGLRGRLTVISSPPRGARENSSYPWLWRYMSHFNVGSNTRAVQHAKLWAFHWKVGDQDLLELHVSSTNLTPSAFRSQLQAGWQATLPLAKNDSSKLRTWGELVRFLGELGTSAGANAAERLQRLVALIGCVRCPAGVVFVASVPGQKHAARQLGQFKPSAIHLMVPTIGDWNARTLRGWCADVGIAPSKLQLKWIASDHPWAKPEQWTLSSKAHAALTASGVQLQCFPRDARLTGEHRDGDERWSHAKLYLIRSRGRKKRRLLVTSANWSASAWGAGETEVRNFELGVVIDSEWTDLEGFEESFDPPRTVPFCVDRADDDARNSALEWAEASWDGERIALRARSTNVAAPISAIVNSLTGDGPSIRLNKDGASMPWSDVANTPLTARFEQTGEIPLEVAVLDLRPEAKFAGTPLPEVDPTVEQALRQAFLLQRYGGSAVDPDPIHGLGGERSLGRGAAPAADYAVQDWVEAREAFGVVDNWLAALQRARSDALLRLRVCRDGAALRALFGARKGPAAGLVAEELGWHLEDEA